MHPPPPAQLTPPRSLPSSHHKTSQLLLKQNLWQPRASSDQHRSWAPSAEAQHPTCENDNCSEKVGLKAENRLCRGADSHKWGKSAPGSAFKLQLLPSRLTGACIGNQGDSAHGYGRIDTSSGGIVRYSTGYCASCGNSSSDCVCDAGQQKGQGTTGSGRYADSTETRKTWKYPGVPEAPSDSCMGEVSAPMKGSAGDVDCRDRVRRVVRRPAPHPASAEIGSNASSTCSDWKASSAGSDWICKNAGSASRLVPVTLGLCSLRCCY
jgi:hypothetical protein